MSNLWSKSVFAKNLKYYVQLSGNTQKELAEVAGVSPPTFNDWVNGKKFPRIDKIQKLADYFGILKSDLIEDKNEKPADESGELSKDLQELIQRLKELPEDKIQMLLQVAKSIR